jgi:hypothetical protein
MTPGDILGLFIRIFGLLVAVYGIYNMLFAASAALDLVMAAHSPAGLYMLFGAIYVILGVVVLRAADKIVAFAYPRGQHRD